MIDPRFETVLAEADATFRCVHLRCDDFAADHAWHYHPEYELLWVIRSQGTRFVGDSIERYFPGDLVLNGPNLPHCYRNEAVEGVEDPPEWMLLQFDSAWLSQLLALPEARPVARLLRDAASGISFSPATAAQVGPLMRALAAQSGLGRIIRLLEILTVLAESETQVRLAASDYQLTNEINPTHLRRIEEVQRYVRDNLSGAISQSEIADRLGLRASAFSKFFKAATGQTFMGLVKLVRVNEACRLLTGTSRRITDIALDCGYQHTSHFDTQFFEVKGMSPSEYRRRTRLRYEDSKASPVAVNG